jgi:hypothetical protein
MAMSKMLGRAGQTSEQAIKSVTRHLSYELDFGAGAPWNKTVPEWHTLTPAQKGEVSKPILSSSMDFVKKLTGAEEFQRVAGTGAWKADLNPAFRSSFIASPEVAGDVANMMGYLGQQTAVHETRWAPKGKNLGLAVHGKGLDDPATLSALWHEGFSPALNADGVPGLEMTFGGGGSKLERRIQTDLIPTLEAAAEKLGLDNIDVHDFRANTQLHGNDWQVNPDGAGYIQRLSPRYGPEIQSRLDHHSRTELEPALRAEIARVKAAEASGVAKTKNGQKAVTPKNILSVGGLGLGLGIAGQSGLIPGETGR